MKKTAVLLYPGFCNYEFAPLLEILALEQKPVVFFGKTKEVFRSEEGLPVCPDQTLDDLVLEEYDSLVLTGVGGVDGSGFDAMITDEAISGFVARFRRPEMIVGAISSAPMLLAKNDFLIGKKYMAAVDREWFEDGGEAPVTLTAEQLDGLYDMKRRPELPEGTKFLREGNILTSYGWYFREWAVEFARMLGIDDSYGGCFGDDLT